MASRQEDFENKINQMKLKRILRLNAGLKDTLLKERIPALSASLW